MIVYITAYVSTITEFQNRFDKLIQKWSKNDSKKQSYLLTRELQSKSN